MSSTTTFSQEFNDSVGSMSAASLYVGDILPHVTEVAIYKKFAPLGTVTSVKLCRDWATGKSLCYAYVNFENPAEAEKAYRTLNYELLEGHPMRIVKSTRNPWLQKGGDPCCQHHHCCSHGGKGLVDAKTLVEAIETYSLAFKQSLSMQDSADPKGPTGYKYSSDFLKRINNANNQYTNVFIKNFKDLLDDYKLWKLCKQFGEIVSAKVMVDEYGISKGFGFACFTDSDAAQRAVFKLNGLNLDGRTLYAGPAMTRTQRHHDPTPWLSGDDNRREDQRQTEWRPQTVSSRICIRNLRDLVDDERLYNEFQRFGPVRHWEVLKTPDGQARGTGYVDFKDKSDAAKALNCMNGKAFYGSRITVSYVAHTNTVSTNTSDNCIGPGQPGGDDFGSYCNNSEDWDMNEKKARDKPVHRFGTGNDGDNCSNSKIARDLMKIKSLANLASKGGRPININDIGNFTSNSVNRNSSNNTDINTSNNALLASAPRKSDLGPSEGSGVCRERASRGFATTDTKRDKDIDLGLSAYDIEADDSEDMDTTATLCVKNLDESISDEKLENLFTTFGTVVSAKVVSNEFGDSKGFGFVIMSEAQDAVKAIKSLDGRIVVNRPIYVAPAAQPRPLGGALAWSHGTVDKEPRQNDDKATHSD